MKTKNNDPIKQHYVPITYLSSFSTKKKDKEIIFVLSKKTNNIYPSNIEKVAMQHNFYTVDLYKDKFSVENFFAQNIEPHLAKILKYLNNISTCVIIQDKAIIIDENLKHDIAFCLAFQFLRATNTRKVTKKFFEKLLPEVLEKSKKFIEISEEKKLSAYKSFSSDEKYFKQVAVECNYNENLIKKIISVLVSRVFTFYNITDDSLFVTSDNPVVFIDAIDKSATPFKNGIKNKRTIAVYPVNPKLLLVVYDEIVCPSKNYMDCRIQKVDALSNGELINFYNCKQKEACFEYIYSESDAVLKKQQ